MLILQNTPVRCEKWNSIHTGCSDDDLIRRVTVQAAWELCGLNRHLGRSLEQLHPGVRHRLFHPFFDSTGQLSSPIFDEFRDFPAGNCTASHAVLHIGLDDVPLFVLQPASEGRFVDHPHPSVYTMPPRPSKVAMPTNQQRRSGTWQNLK